MASTIIRFVLGLFAMVPDSNDHIPAKRHRHRAVDTYEVFSDDFERIEEEGSRVGTDLQFATAWLPVAITLTVTLCTATIQNKHIFTAFYVLMWVSYGFGIFHGFNAWKQRGRFKRLLETIKKNQIAPLGEKGNELRPSQLEDLPSQEEDGK